MKRLAAIAAGVLVTGLSVAAIVVALTDSGSPPPATAGVESAGRAAASTGPRTDAAGLDAEAIYKRVAPGVVVITATRTETTPGSLFLPPTRQQVEVLGSGFVIDRRGDIVTNDHVVANGSDVRAGFSNGATYPAKTIGTDPSTDLAVIRVQAPGSVLHPLELGDSASVEVGDRVYAIGNPFGLTETMTAGIVSATGRDITAPNGLGIPNAIQTDAAINHGNSGGPLLDGEGTVIGVNDQIDSGGTVDGNVGIGFAIASSTVKAVTAQLIANGHVEHAWLGVEVLPASELVGDIDGLPARGLLVVKVAAGSPAAKAGLEAAQVATGPDGQRRLGSGDAIVSVDGTRVDSPEKLQAAVQAAKPGDRLELGIVRAGQDRTVTVTLENAPATG